MGKDETDGDDDDDEDDATTGRELDEADREEWTFVTELGIGFNRGSRGKCNSARKG